MRPSFTAQGQQFASIAIQCLPEPVSSQDNSFVHRSGRSRWLVGLFVLLLICIGWRAPAQAPAKGENPSFTKTIPPSPNAASLGKYGDVPVSYYTGIPDISIPLYEISSGDLSLPISLSYHAGGIKVEEIASWVGLGWSLSAGGVITRTVRGIADDSPMELHGNYKSNIDYLLNDSISLFDLKERFVDIVDRGHGDTQPDVFAFNFGKYSGKFFIGEDGETFYVMPQQKISIEVEARNGRLIEQWKIITEDGVQYIFGKDNSGADGLEYNSSYSVCQDVSTANREASSWFLIKIISPKGYSISIDYEPYSYDFRTFGSESIYYRHRAQSTNVGEDRVTNCYVRNSLEGRRIKQIVFKGGRIEFNSRSTYRVDLNDKALDSVNIFKDDEASPIKSYRLAYSYFVPTQGQVIPQESTGPNEQDETGSGYRLKLVSLTEVNSSGTSKPPYEFFYDETHSLPPRIPQYLNPTSYGQDHWGYYNGKMSNKNEAGVPTLIPTLDTDLGEGFVRRVKGADRASDEIFMHTGVLQKIVYPTGGYSEFEFEANKVSSGFFDDPLLLPFELKNAGANLHSTTNSGTAYGGLFTVNSGTSRDGVLGALVDVKLIELADTTIGCRLSDPAVDRGIYSATDSTLIRSNSSLTNGGQTFLPNGTYYVRLDKKNSYFCETNFSIALSWQNYAFNTGAQVKDIAVGGLRVKKITDHNGQDHNKDVVRFFKYHRFSDPIHSSGRLDTIPLYKLNESSDAPGELYGEVHEDANPYMLWFHVWNSFTNYPLATTSGGYVGYSNVTVEFGQDGANGKTEYTFTSYDSFPNLPRPPLFVGAPTDPQAFPFPPTCNVDWRRGKDISEITYRNTNGIFYPISQKFNYYNFHSATGQPLQYTATGMKIGVKSRYVNSLAASRLDDARFPLFDTRTEWVTLDSTVTITYDNNDITRSKKTTEIYQYKPTHQQMSARIMRTSKGEKLIENMSYPEDYSGITSQATGSARGIYLMQQQHIVNQVIEKYTIKEWKDGMRKVVNGQLNSFNGNPLIAGQVVPDTTYVLETDHALPLSGQGAFVTSHITANAFIKDPTYKRAVVFRQFDGAGNVKEAQKENDILYSFVWGYDLTRPIAEVKNAQVRCIFHTSFEDANGTASSTARTGANVKAGTFNFYLPSVQGNYVLTYYKRAVGQTAWQFNAEAVIVNSGNATTSKTIGQSGYEIDEVRFYPVGATMTTYTYDPLIGMTTATNENGLTTYYEFDSFGRLHYVRDNDRNIVKVYDYTYQLREPSTAQH